jgi:hypothetical protein
MCKCCSKSTNRPTKLKLSKLKQKTNVSSDKALQYILHNSGSIQDYLEFGERCKAAGWKGYGLEGILSFPSWQLIASNGKLAHEILLEINKLDDSQITDNLALLGYHCRHTLASILKKINEIAIPKSEYIIQTVSVSQY